MSCSRAESVSSSGGTVGVDLVFVSAKYRRDRGGSSRGGVAALDCDRGVRAGPSPASPPATVSDCECGRGEKNAVMAGCDGDGLRRVDTSEVVGTDKWVLVGV